MPYQKQDIVNNRYRIVDKLGEGGMGIVYRAFDRLIRREVALKQVQIPEKELVFNSLSGTSSVMSVQVALAQEFKTLASLRHPNIITVLDYGFDVDDQTPFFTMELLQASENVLEACKRVSESEKVNYLLQVLQALEYLHRRGILHRDIKPDNIQVIDGRVKVLDFGLAVARGYAQQEEIVGTLAYMPPEILRSAPPSTASDLYAVGLIAYEIFAGTFPYNHTDLTQLIQDIVSLIPDTDAMDCDPLIANVTARLLEKDPDDRYQQAFAILNEYAQASGEIQYQRDEQIRESYLQSARFVGRDEEMAQLQNGLERAIVGQGNIWLVAGESGVGKTRLLDELRTIGLVKGVQVLRGQAIEEGGLSYVLWRDVVRCLTLVSENINAEIAGVLFEIVPDIADILEHEVQAAPKVDPENQRERLIKAILQLFEQFDRPILLILEDIHWAIESLEVMLRLASLAQRRPVMIVASFRNDERPELAALVPDANIMLLDRFDLAEISQLSEAMLGETGTQAHLIDLLQRETEGNPFFIVEVIRVLADDAGMLEQVGMMTLPESVVASGVQQLVKHRLSRVSPAAFPALETAAVMGREPDIDLLHRILPDIDMDGWLVELSDASILQITDEHWQFTHDKIRHGILAQIDDDKKQRLHRQIAETIESHDPDLSAQAIILVYHWAQAGDAAKELEYSRIAGEQSLRVGSFAQAIQYFSRCLALLDISQQAQRAPHHYYQGLAYKGLSELANSKDALEKAIDAYDKSGDDLGKSRALGVLGQVLNDLGEVDEAETTLDLALQLAQQKNDAISIATAKSHLSRVQLRKGDFDRAKILSIQAIELFEQEGDAAGVATAKFNVAAIGFYTGDYESGKAYSLETLDFFRKTGNRERIVSCLNNLGALEFMLGNTVQSKIYLEEVLPMCREMGDQIGVAAALNNLGDIAYRTGDYEAARPLLEESIEIFKRIQHNWGVVGALNIYANTLRELEQFEQANATFRQSISMAQDIDATPMILDALQGIAELRQSEQAGATQITPILEVILAHPATDSNTHDRATELYTLLNGEHSGRTEDQAIDTRLAQIIREVLTSI